MRYLSPINLRNRIRDLAGYHDALRAKVEAMSAPASPGGLTLYDPDPPRLTPDEGAMTRGVWDDIEAQDRRIVGIREAWIDAANRKHFAVVERGDGSFDKVEMEEEELRARLGMTPPGPSSLGLGRLW